MNCHSIQGGTDGPEIFITRIISGISCHHILHTNWYRKHQSPWSTLLADIVGGWLVEGAPRNTNMSYTDTRTRSLYS